MSIISLQSGVAGYGAGSETTNGRKVSGEIGDTGEDAKVPANELDRICRPMMRVRAVARAKTRTSLVFMMALPQGYFCTAANARPIMSRVAGWRS